MGQAQQTLEPGGGWAVTGDESTAYFRLGCTGKGADGLSRRRGSVRGGDAAGIFSLKPWAMVLPRQMGPWGSR